MHAINSNVCTEEYGEIITEASSAQLPPGNWPAAVTVDGVIFALDHFDVSGEEIAAAMYIDPKTRKTLCILND